MTQLPQEARDGLLRAWLKVLSDRHPQVTWVPVGQQAVTDDKQVDGSAELARSA